MNKQFLVEVEKTFNSVIFLVSTVLVRTKDEGQPLSHLEQLKEELRNKNILFPNTCLQLTRVIGQGVYSDRNVSVAFILSLILQANQGWCIVGT